MLWREACPILYFSARGPCNTELRIENTYQENSMWEIKTLMCEFQEYREKPKYLLRSDIKLHTELLS